MGERARELFTLILGDIVSFNVALWLMLLVRYLELPTMERLHDHFGPFLILSGIWLILFYVSGLYDKHTTFLKRVLVNRLLYIQILNMLIASVLFFTVNFGIAPRVNLVLYLIVSIVVILVWRLKVFPHLSPKQEHKAILIADGEEAIELADEINNNDRYNYYFIRIINSDALRSTPDSKERIAKLIKRERVKIIVADPRLEHIEDFLPVLFDLSFLQFTYTFFDFNKLYEETFDRVPVSSLKYEWFFVHISQVRNVAYDIIKRGIDIVGAVILLLPSAVLFPFVALAIKLEDRGAIFYTTERIGQFNRIITIYKLRTKNGTDSGTDALKSTLVDTRVGIMLRKTRIDELPQLLNVLRGDLSFIGPRPEMPALAEVYAKEIPYYNTRHLIKPGLSGWAQINNFDVPRGGVDVERTIAKLSHDLFYLKHRSLLLDIQITLKTANTILMRTGT